MPENTAVGVMSMWQGSHKRRQVFELVEPVVSSPLPLYTQLTHQLTSTRNRVYSLTSLLWLLNKVTEDNSSAFCGTASCFFVMWCIVNPRLHSNVRDRRKKTPNWSWICAWLWKLSPGTTDGGYCRNVLSTYSDSCCIQSEIRCREQTTVSWVGLHYITTYWTNTCKCIIRSQNVSNATCFIWSVTTTNPVHLSMFDGKEML